MDSEKKKPSEQDLFRHAMSDVSPLNPSNRIEPIKKRPPARLIEHEVEPDLTLKEDISILIDPGEFDAGGGLVFLRPGYQKRILKRLRRGHYGTADTIDLHNLNQHNAQKMLMEFLSHSTQCGFSCVRVIHGKGLRSENGPRIKIMTRQVLLQHPKVVAFISCRPEDGGTGAVNVLLVVQQERSE